MGKALNAQEILALDDMKRVEVDVPEWGGSVLVRSLTRREMDEWDASRWVAGPDGKLVWNGENIEARFTALCAVDDEGNRLFDDAETLGTKNAVAVGRIFAAAQKVNGIGVEAGAKNS